MKLDFLPGFMEVDFGDDEVKFIVVHSPLSWEFIPRGDVGVDLVAVRLARKFKTKALISLIPKEGNYGINFNRLPPSFKEAKKGFEFYEKRKFGGMYRVLIKLAFTASNRKEYEEKMKIYKSFWGRVVSFVPSTSLFVFLHTQSTVLKNLPSLIDVTTYRTIERRIIKEAIAQANEKYKKVFERIRKSYLEYCIFSTKFFFYNSARQRFGCFDPRKFKGGIRINWKKSIKRARELGVKMKIDSLESLVKAIKKVKQLPIITFEKNFKGKYSHAPKKYLKGKKCLQLEVCSFLSEAMPDLAEKLIAELIVRLKGLNSSDFS